VARGGVRPQHRLGRLRRTHHRCGERDDGIRSSARRESVSRHAGRRAGIAAQLVSPLRVALVHDYLNQRGGAERVFARIAQAWPDAPIFTALYDERAVGDLIPRSRVRASWLARIPGANRNFRYLAPLYPSAFEAFDLRGYDLIVSSTSAWAKGVRYDPGAKHLCYIYTVSRFVFDYERYLGGFGVASLARPVVAQLARWDLEAATRPTEFVAISNVVAERVRRYYGRDARVLVPPIEIERFTPGAGGGGYVLVVSRLLPYKRVDLAIDAARLANVKLVVVGSGPSEAALRERAAGAPVEMLGFVGDERVAELMREARAIVLPGEEDLGLVPIEAAACGRPAIAYRAGGALETVIEGETGAFFDEQTPESLAAVLRGFDERAFDPVRLRAHAETFGPERFTAGLRALARDLLR
jgi:glycosyltransferase involved in cell wall biosynthesis